MKSILVIATTDLSRDPRVDRQLNILVEAYSVAAIGSAAPNSQRVSFFPMLHPGSLFKKIKSALMLLFGQYQSYYWSRGYIKSALSAIDGQHFDIILANDILTLPLAIKIANGTSRVIFDAHEYSPREYEDRWVWRLFFQGLMCYLCQNYLSRTDGMMTVCQGIAEEYHSEFGVKPVVVTNAPPFHNIQPSSVEGGKIRMIHHGGASPARHLETMIEMMKFLDDRFQLDFMLIPSDPGYLERLKKLAAIDRRIHFVEPVAMRDIPKVCNSYDVGVYLLPPVNFNHLHALPNKLFEFMQARLAIAIGPSPEMQRLVQQYDCGVVASDFTPQALAKSLSALTAERICYFKQQSHLAAKELCAEQNAKTIIDLVEGH